MCEGGKKKKKNRASEENLVLQMLVPFSVYGDEKPVEAYKLDIWGREKKCGKRERKKKKDERHRNPPVGLMPQRPTLPCEV